jgi:hypothetical protein
MTISIFKYPNELEISSISSLDFIGHIEFKTTKNKNEIVERIHKDKF